MTVAIDDDAKAANARIDQYLENYYSTPAAAIRKRQACYGGASEGLGEWMQGFAAAGATQIVLRFAGDHERHLQRVSDLRRSLGWL